MSVGWGVRMSFGEWGQQCNCKLVVRETVNNKQQTNSHLLSSVDGSGGAGVYEWECSRGVVGGEGGGFLIGKVPKRRC